MKANKRGLFMMANLLAVAAMLGGCDSSKKRSGGEGGQAGAVVSQVNDGGVQGLGGASASAGATGLSAGGTSSVSTNLGGETGTAAGGDSTGGTGGGRSSGAAGTGGASTAVTSGGGASTVDAGSNPDVPPACRTIRIQADCDQRNDCHSVSIDDQAACGCSTPGCCLRLLRCDDGGAVACAGRINCMQPMPSCGAPYAVQYRSDTSCYEGCVLASKCLPTATCPSAAPANGTNCGSNALSCVYQDCAGAGRTQATCQGGTWDVQTVTCDSVSCKGGGLAISGVICGPGQICVHTTEAGGAYRITPSCATNNCGSSPVSLSCVQGLSGSCTVRSDSEISCSMPLNCGGSTSCPP